MLHMCIFNIHKIPVFCGIVFMTKLSYSLWWSLISEGVREGEGFAKIVWGLEPDVWETPFLLVHLFVCPLS